MEFVIIIIWVLCAFIGRSMAITRNRSAGAGFAMGLFLGIIGLIIIALMGEQKPCNQLKRHQNRLRMLIIE